MLFYYLLIDNDRSRDWYMKRGEMAYVEPDSKGQFLNNVFTIQNDEVKIVKQQIKDTYTKIKAHEFEKGCGEENCYWCNFVRYYLKKGTYVSEELPGSSVEERIE